METYRIAVLGAGKVGGTLGKKWLAAGHEVTFGVRDPGSSRLQSLQSESGTPPGGSHARSGTGER